MFLPLTENKQLKVTDNFTEPLRKCQGRIHKIMEQVMKRNACYLGIAKSISLCNHSYILCMMYAPQTLHMIYFALVDYYIAHFTTLYEISGSHGG
jgi:hypothetical protein